MPADPPRAHVVREISESIAEWIEANNELPSLGTNEAVSVSFSVEIMNRTLYLLRTGVALAPYGTQDRGVTRNRAIITGHMVRLMKLYDCFLMHACNQDAPRFAISS